MIEKALDLLKRGKITLYEYREIESICIGEIDKTILINVAKFFESQNVKMEKNGIGWKIDIRSEK